MSDSTAPKSLHETTSQISTAPKSVYETNQQIAVMVDLVDGDFKLDEPTKEYMRAVGKIISTAARELTGLKSAGVELDQGQLNATIQLLQQAKNKACEAAIVGCESRKRRQELKGIVPDAKKLKEQQ